MSIYINDKSGVTPQQTLLAGISPVDQILDGTSKNAIANKAVYNALADKIEKTVQDLIYYYDKSQVYNRAEVRELIGAINTLTITVVSTLPSQDISTTTIYFLGPTSGKYDEYVYVNNAWVKIGDTEVDLSGYMTTTAFTTAIADYYTKAEIDAIVAGYYTKAQVDSALNAKQNTLTFDSTPTAGSTNPVTSAGIKTAIDAVDNTATVNKLNACYYNVRFTGTSDIEADMVTLINTIKAKSDGTYYGDFVRVTKNAGSYVLSKYTDSVNSFVIGVATTGSQTYTLAVANNNTPTINKVLYAKTPTRPTSVAPFQIIKNSGCINISTRDGATMSDKPLTAYTWATNVRALGTLDSHMDSSVYAMVPTVFQSGNNFYDGVARIFYSGRVDFWCTESISGSYIPYLNITLPITE